MVRDAKTLVSNGGKSRKGEKRKNPKKKSDRDQKKRKLESATREEKRAIDNLEHEKNGLRKCPVCRIVLPESRFSQHAPTSGKFSRFEGCVKCLDAQKESRVRSGITQWNGDRNATRSNGHQLNIKANLRGKPGFEEYEAECDAANPPKTAQMFKIRCTKEEMVEKLPLVGHGLVDSFHSNCFS